MFLVVFLQVFESVHSHFPFATHQTVAKRTSTKVLFWLVPHLKIKERRRGGREKKRKEKKRREGFLVTWRNTSSEKTKKQKTVTVPILKKREFLGPLFLKLANPVNLVPQSCCAKNKRKIMPPKRKRAASTTTKSKRPRWSCDEVELKDDKVSFTLLVERW